MTVLLTFRREIPLAPDGVGTGSGPSPSAPSSPSGGAPSSAPSGAPSSTPSTPSSTPSAAPSRGAPAPGPSPAPTSTPGRSYGPKGPPSKPVAEPPAFDFSTLFDSPPDQPSVEAPPPGQPTVLPPGVPPVPPQQGQPQVPPQAGVQPGGPAQPGAQRPHLDPADPITLARALVEHEKLAVDYASQAFKLTNEEVEALETNVIGTIPKLLGKVMVRVQQQQLAQLSRIVPMMIDRYASVMRRHYTNEERFYAAWPGLDRNRHGDLVRRYGAVYRQMHPQTTLDAMIRDLGPMVMMAAGVQPGTVAPRPGNGQSMPRSQHQPSAFVPAGGGASGMQSTPQPGVFDFLGQSE